MATISLCMIVKNEQQVLARCLDSVRGAVDEIVIVDTGSTDSTREIALRYTDRVYDFLWIDDFSAARNFSFDQATMDYCMWLDADDVLTAEDRDGLIALKSSLLPETDVVMMKYNTAFDSAGRPTFSYYRERILRRGKFRWEGAVHEVIAPSGVILHSPLAVTHQKLHAAEPGRNLRIFEKLLAGGRVLTPREQFYYARELYYAGRYQEAAAAFEALGSYKDSAARAANLQSALERYAAELERVQEQTEALEAALAGATREAIAVISDKSIGLSVGGKIGIARTETKIAVCLFFGVGILHIDEVVIGFANRAI